MVRSLNEMQHMKHSAGLDTYHMLDHTSYLIPVINTITPAAITIVVVLIIVQGQEDLEVLMDPALLYFHMESWI